MEITNMPSVTASPKLIDPLAVDQEPTDEQLAAVMDDVARVARQKRAVADVRFREQMAQDMRAAEVRMTYLRKQFNLTRR
jgi:hypothetical protein